MAMLKVNLLPEAARKTTLSPIEQFHRTPLMWAILALVVVIPVVLWMPMQRHDQQLQRLNNTIHMLEPKRAEVERLQQALEQLRIQDAAFRGMQKGQGIWSKRLNTISNVTPDGVWFTDLALDEVKGLVIQGSAIGQADPELANVTHLAQALKADADFASAFKDINIESIRTVPEGDIEIVQFTLTCPLRETPK